MFQKFFSSVILPCARIDNMFLNIFWVDKSLYTEFKKTEGLLWYAWSYTLDTLYCFAVASARIPKLKNEGEKYSDSAEPPGM